MTRESFLEREPTDTEAFEAALAELLTAAISNGVNPRGNYAFRDGKTPEGHALATNILDGKHPQNNGKRPPTADDDWVVGDSVAGQPSHDGISHDWEIQIIELQQRPSDD